MRFNYLSDPRDAQELVEGVRRALDIVYAPAFDPFRAEMRLPETRNASDAELEAFVRATCGTDYHPSGTAKMGSGADAVVMAEVQRVRQPAAMPTAATAPVHTSTTCTQPGTPGSNPNHGS